MLNIKELSGLLADQNAPAEDTRTTLIVIALVEQRLVLERIAGLLDVGHMDSGDMQGQLGRIADAFEEHNKRLEEILKDPPEVEMEESPIGD